VLRGVAAWIAFDLRKWVHSLVMLASLRQWASVVEFFSCTERGLRASVRVAE